METSVERRAKELLPLRLAAFILDNADEMIGNPLNNIIAAFFLRSGVETVEIINEHIILRAGFQESVIVYPGWLSWFSRQIGDKLTGVSQVSYLIHVAEQDYAFIQDMALTGSFVK